MTYGDQGLSVRRRVIDKATFTARRATAPLMARLSSLRGQQFDAWPGARLDYFVHPYNTTWRNERAVEVPIALDFLTRHGHGRGMEFGNVLSHYDCQTPREIVDKYDTDPAITAMDIVDYEPAAPLDFIVSLSTLEHVGWDEHPREPGKVDEAFDRLRSLLGPEGRMLVSAPLGYNDVLDEAVLSHRWPVLRELTMVDDDGWRPTAEVEWRAYDTGRGARSVWFAEVGPTGR